MQPARAATVEAALVGIHVAKGIERELGDVASHALVQVGQGVAGDDAVGDDGDERALNQAVPAHHRRGQHGREQ